MKRIRVCIKDRFDLGFKLKLARRIANGGYSNVLMHEYLQLLYFWNGLKEPNSEKAGAHRFVASFREMVNKEKESHEQKLPPIPVNQLGKIQNGSHRLAISLSLKKTPVFYLASGAANYNYYYFQKYKSVRGRLPKILLLKMLLRNFEFFNRDIRVAIVFPRAMQRDNGQKAYEILENNIVWDQVYDVDEKLLEYIIMNLYPGETWLDLARGGLGIRSKKNSVIAKSVLQRIRLLVYYEDTGFQTKNKKDIIREFYGIGKSSIHISDNTTDARSAIYAIFSISSAPLEVRNINYRSSVLGHLNDKFHRITADIEECNGIMLVGSGPLDIFGVRPAKDLDFISSLEGKPLDGYSQHNPYFFFYSDHPQNLIDNLDNKLFLFGLPVAKLSTVIEFKKRRRERKDVEDISLIRKIFN